MATTMASKKDDASSSSSLRIASLLPAATDICVALGLDLVGVTHECDYPDTDGGIIRLTKCGLLPDSSQSDIHLQVQQAVSSSSSSLLYPILPNEWKRANPNLVLTQDLCAVCGPTSSSVCELQPQQGSSGTIQTISLSPASLEQVGETMVTIADACGIQDKGEVLQRTFWSQIRSVQTLVHERVVATKQPQPKVLLLEWLDPPFDGGHWIPDMMAYAAGAHPPQTKKPKKSVAMSWQQVYEQRPDVILVACCGFDLQRNMNDAWNVFSTKQHMLPSTTRIYAADGNQYFARPGPKLCGGVAILAMVAHEPDKMLLDVIQALDFAPARGQGWDRLEMTSDTNTQAADAVDSTSIPDVEDFGLVHETACRRGDLTYPDPATGYSVFTELAHKARGKCCGSGCRHCPYHHVNVKDKASLIQKPAYLYTASSATRTTNSPIKVLFFSGGKDSFLTIRALLRNAAITTQTIILLTTFDATTRIVTNQEIPIHDIVRQAKHLDLSLVGIPRHRASGLDYVNQIRQGLDLIESTLQQKVTALVFGDLHLEHIRSWREDRLAGALGYRTEYPLWQVPYEDLMRDLEASQVPCVVSNSTVESVKVGTLFTRAFFESLVEVDGFGENGEFHSLAKVWETDRTTALGLSE